MRKYRILIADDEKLECMVLEKMIHDNGVHAEVLPTAKDGIDLIEKAESLHPDIILADINMPGLTGLQAIEIILTRYPATKIILVTAYSRFEYAKKALSLGVTEYILKPVKEAELITALNKTILFLDQDAKYRSMIIAAQSFQGAQEDRGSEQPDSAEGYTQMPWNAPVKRNSGTGGGALYVPGQSETTSDTGGGLSDIRNKGRGSRDRCRLLIQNMNLPVFLEELEGLLQQGPAEWGEDEEEKLKRQKVYLLSLFQEAVGLFFRASDSEDAERFQKAFFLYDTYWLKIQKCEDSLQLLQAAREICAGLEGGDSHSLQQRHIINSLKYISAHYTQELSLEEVATASKISTFYLSRLFRQESGYTFLEVLTFLRISKSLELLFSTKMPTHEISEQCGYINTSYFYKLFKKQTGMTMGEIRRLW